MERNFLTVMVNNTTKVNKTNSHKKVMMAVEIQVLIWDRNKNVKGLNQLMGSPF
jgi:hypothetical protein